MPKRRADSPFEVRADACGRGLFARGRLRAGTRLFGADDWADDGAERASFIVLSPRAVAALAPPARAAFLRYAYHCGPRRIAGTFHHAAVRHPSNFINHGCEPNAGYDGGDAIVTLRTIAAGEEIRMDYGTYSFAFDHDFVCRCGAPSCRGRVARHDWKALVRRGLKLPRFMQAQVERLLRPPAARGPR
jgi:uncharacterized protein